LTEATNNTDVGGLKVPPGQLAHHVGKGTAITLGILAVIPAVVIPVVATRGSKSAPPQGQCPPVKGCT
jgi:hypothetical protein